MFLSQGSFSSTPTVLVTAEHYRRSLKHDAASVWLEDITSSSFKVCLRELQNFDGSHQGIYVVRPKNYIFFKTGTIGEKWENKKRTKFKGQIQFEVLRVKILE